MIMFVRILSSPCSQLLLVLLIIDEIWWNFFSCLSQAEFFLWDCRYTKLCSEVHQYSCAPSVIRLFSFHFSLSWRLMVDQIFSTNKSSKIVSSLILPPFFFFLSSTSLFLNNPMISKKTRRNNIFLAFQTSPHKFLLPFCATNLSGHWMLIFIRVAQGEPRFHANSEEHFFRRRQKNDVSVY